MQKKHGSWGSAACGFAVLALFAAPAPASANPITFDLTGGGGVGTKGNQLTFDEGDVTMFATAWFTSGGSLSSTFAKAALGQWGTGLGVCNSSEGSLTNCRNSGNVHQVDNVGQRDYVLFLFDEAVRVHSVVVDPYNTWDTDASYWLGNVSTVPGFSLAGFRYSGLGGLGLGSEKVSSGPTTSSPVTHNVPDPALYNALLFGARRSGSDDRFKIASIDVWSPDAPDRVATPEPSSILLVVAGFAALARRLRRRHTN